MSAYGLEHPAVLCSLGIIQVLGLISAFATRLARPSRRWRASQWVFFTCLGLVAMSMILTLGASSGSWLTSGTTLSLMVLTAVWDFGRQSDCTAW